MTTKNDVKFINKMLKNSYFSCAAFILSTILLTSCTLYDDPIVPPVPLPEQFKSNSKPSAKKLKEKWWENFNNAKLNCLVEMAVKNNYDYKIALKNIKIAQTYVTQNASNLFPQVNLNFNSTRNKTALANLQAFGNTGTVKTAPIYNLQQLSGTVNYEVDVWNQIRNSVNQAKANKDMAVASSRVVKLTLITSVVDGYFQVVALNSNLINLNKQLRVASEIAKLTDTQFQSGLIDASALYSTKNQVETVKINIDNLENQKQVILNTLAYLLGEYPECFNYSFDNEFKNFQPKNLVPPALPSEMLCNRPDIQSAFYQVLSYGYLEKQNIANFLPSINLTGTYGYASNALSQLISSAHSYWNYGVYMTQFVFDYQTRMSEYKRSKYQYESAILSYKASVFNAFKEVDNALSSYKQDKEALLSFQKQTVNLGDLLSLTKAQYQSGLTDYLSYSTNSLNYLQSQYNTTNQKLLLIEDVIQIYKSLGLGLDDC